MQFVVDSEAVTPLVVLIFDFVPVRFVAPVADNSKMLFVVMYTAGSSHFVPKLHS